MKLRIYILTNKKSLGRIPTGRRPSQTFSPRKGKGSYRRNIEKKVKDWD